MQVKIKNLSKTSDSVNYSLVEQSTHETDLSPQRCPLRSGETQSPEITTMERSQGTNRVFVMQFKASMNHFYLFLYDTSELNW